MGGSERALKTNQKCKCGREGARVRAKRVVWEREIRKLHGSPNFSMVREVAMTIGGVRIPILTERLVSLFHEDFARLLDREV